MIIYFYGDDSVPGDLSQLSGFRLTGVPIKRSRLYLEFGANPKDGFRETVGATGATGTVGAAGATGDTWTVGPVGATLVHNNKYLPYTYCLQ